MIPNTTGYRILIVDKYPMMREILSDYFAKEHNCAASSSAPDISSAIDLLNSEPVDVVLLDYDLGNELTFSFFQRLPEIAFKVPVLILSTGINQAAVQRLLSLGAAGVVWKTSTMKDLSACVRDVVGGETWETSEHLRRAIRGTSTRMPAWAVPFSERQAQVLRGIADGHANKEIAAQLGVSETSVKCTVQQIFVKTGVHSRSELVRFLLERFPGELAGDLSNALAS